MKPLEDSQWVAKCPPVDNESFMNSPAVSVIIPSYNRRETIGRALDSVLNQTYALHEVIVVDDGSTDETAERVEKDYPSVQIVKQSNQGVSAARNTGIAASTGEWLAFLDSDDRWLPQKLMQQMTALERAPGHRVCHTDEIWIRRGVRVNQMNKHRKSGGRIFERCLELCCISPSSSIVHRSVFSDLGPFDESLPACEDYDLWLRITAREPVLYVDEMLIEKYGGHEDQLSQKHWGMDRFRVAAIEKILGEGVLNHQDTLLAWQMLKTKSRILMLGAQKRSKHTQAALFEQKYVNASEQVDGLLDGGKSWH